MRVSVSFTLKGKERNPLIENETLTLTKAYFDAKGESFLPEDKNLLADPQGHVKHILENLDIIPMPEPKPFGIPIPLKRINPPPKKSSC